jgi:hypothetical protein
MSEVVKKPSKMIYPGKLTIAEKVREMGTRSEQTAYCGNIDYIASQTNYWL